MVVPSVVRHSGHGIGDGINSKVYGKYTFHLAPREQKIFGGWFREQGRMINRHYLRGIHLWAPPFIVGYMVYAWAANESDRLSHKDPEMFKNDV